MKDKIRELITQLNRYNELYEQGRPVVSDAHYDSLYFELKRLEETHRIIYPDSPTQSIPFTLSSGLEKVTHTHPMLSLDKTKSIEELERFIGSHGVVVMGKMDGLSCSLIYQDGQLISAETRGNGITGEQVLENAKHIPSIPLTIPVAGRVIVDGEIICKLDDFQEFSEEYANPRNFAAGSIRLLSSQEASARKLTFVAWDVIEGAPDSTMGGRLMFAQDFGFTVVPFYEIFLPALGAIGLEKVINDVKADCAQENYPIDGVVVRYDDLEYGESLGATEHHFRHAIAFKFYDESYPTHLRTIEYDVSRMGVLTPVAVFDPIEIDGSTVERASLHNLNILSEVLGIPRVGQTVYVAKMNQIIPQIVEADNDGELEITCSEYCPVCGGRTEVRESNSTKVLICTNPSCERKLVNQLDHFAGKKGLDIKGLSKATLEKLIDWGWVQSAKDIFTLSERRAEWIQKPGFGAKSVDKVLDAIEQARATTLSRFLVSLGIPLVGTTAAVALERQFFTWEEFIKATQTFDFTTLPDFGPEIHKSILSFDFSEACEIVHRFIIFQATLDNQLAAAPLKEKTFCVTGKLKNFTRDTIKAKIESLGGKVTGSVSSKTDYLINNDTTSTSSKNLSAQKLGIPIISEEEWMQLFDIT